MLTNQQVTGVSQPVLRYVQSSQTSQKADTMESNTSMAAAERLACVNGQLW
jgi:hypothetical protein